MVPTKNVWNKKKQKKQMLIFKQISTSFLPIHIPNIIWKQIEALTNKLQNYTLSLLPKSYATHHVFHLSVTAGVWYLPHLFWWNVKQKCMWFQVGHMRHTPLTKVLLELVFTFDAFLRFFCFFLSLLFSAYNIPLQ